MSLLKREFNLAFSSATAAGAIQKSTDGSRFTVQLDSNIQLPATALAPTISCTSAAVWNVSPNISPALGNNILSIISTLGGGSQVIAIPKGLYSVSDLNAYLALEFVNRGMPSNTLKLGTDLAQGKIVLIFELGSVQVDFTAANSVNTILGFNSALVPAAPSAIGQSVIADNVAAFNAINSYRIKSTLLPGGLPQNNTRVGTIAVIPITQAPGSQIIYTPFNPISIDASILIGANRSLITFELTNQNNVAADTNNEDYEFILHFEWYEKV